MNSLRQFLKGIVFGSMFFNIPFISSLDLTTSPSKKYDTIAFDVDDVLVLRNKIFYITKTIFMEHPFLVIKMLPWAVLNGRTIYTVAETTDVHGVMEWVAQQRPELNTVTESGKTIKDRIIELACTGKPIQGTINLLLDLHGQGYPIAVATNQGRKTFDLLVKEQILPDIEYRLIFTSDYLGKENVLKKPNPKYFEAFKEALTKNNLSYLKTVFTDDKLENVMSAEKCGIKSILFKNPEQLKKELASHGFKFFSTESLHPGKVNLAHNLNAVGSETTINV